ncbi:MAG: GNAT family N-acetyltransferase [Armatimonadetes bacterium]|nr:GNAT family N-acetyltransferase [Armatimonadota bacterium]
MTSSTAIFAAADIEATLAYYKDVLGFESTWTYGEPPNFGGASKGGVSIMFCLDLALASKVAGHQHWVKVDDADELYALHVGRGAKVVSEIGDRPWGVREYVVEDLNGYHLRFAGPPSSEVKPSSDLPDGVTFERRKPTIEEFERVAGAAFGEAEAVPGLLEGTWGGVMALSPDGGAVGLLRVMFDAPGWFSVWDVAVLPEWQAQRIGSKMMQEAMAMIGEASPGALVFLFTFKHGFYERLGFGKETVSMRRV